MAETTSYTLGQYRHKINAEEGWMTPIDITATAVSVQTPLDLGISGIEEMFIESFEDSGLFFNGYFVTNVTYYCHCKVKRDINSIQKFTIKLAECSFVKDGVVSTENSDYEQYIKTINIQQSADDNQWVDVEFTFTPQYNKFNTILLSLSRNSSDFVETSKRTPVVAFLEVSKINNILSSVVGESNVNLLKMGIQSRPGLKMCLNREEISVGRTGIYEVKNGEVKVSFLCFITPATNKTNEQLKNVNKNQSYITEVPSTRPFDGFTLDYIY